MTTEEALARVEEWEREHGYGAEDMRAALDDPSSVDLTRTQIEDGASRWADFEDALQAEAIQRRLAAGERADPMTRAPLDAIE